MKLLMLALLIVSTTHGMQLLRRKVECAESIYLYDLSTDSFFTADGLDLNERIKGKTMLDLIYACKPTDNDFVEFMRQRGARTSSELPAETNPELIRANQLLSHLVPGKVS